MGKKVKAIVTISILYLGIYIFVGCATTSYRDIPFDYSQVLTKEYRFGVGKVIPLTFEHTVNVGGVISNDGAYLVYSSNRERNNFDIYLRQLQSITTVRLTEHPAKDYAPDISPDGKWIAYVSTRDDPEGDIIVMRLHTKRIFEKGYNSESTSRNITIVKDPETKAIIPIRDDWPTFSPDSKYIAFTSTRDGEECIYITDLEGKEIKKITQGSQPRFSRDGKLLAFVRYEQGKSNIYVIHLFTGAIQKITNNNFLELSPCFGANNDDLYFMRVEQDTNSNGKIDENDHGIVMYYNISQKEEYPLTLFEEPSATPRWIPYAGGVVVFSVIEGEFINIAMIPHTGIIPKQKNAIRQYELALRYKEEYDDYQRYLRCLFATYYFFKEAQDIDSQVVIARALYELSTHKEYSYITTLLHQLGSHNIPASVYASYSKEKNKIEYLKRVVKELLQSNKVKAVPYFLEELADAYAEKRLLNDAIATYEELRTKYTEYPRSMYINYKLGELKFSVWSIPQEWITVLQSSYTYLKNSVCSIIVERSSKRPLQEQYIQATRLADASDVPLIKAVYQYIAANVLIHNGQYHEGEKILNAALSNTKKLDLIFFLINKKLGELALARGNKTWVQYYESAVNNYQAQWKYDIQNLIEALIEYFENETPNLISNNIAEAVANYKRYITMNTLLLLKRKYKKIYSLYAAGAHREYINARYIQAHETIPEELEKEYIERLPIARMDFDKAHIYGLGYLYVKKAQCIAACPHDLLGKTKSEVETVLQLFTTALHHIDWSLFIDDRFVDAYLLKGWIYQYIDELRLLYPSKKSLIDAYFTEYLWEKCIPLYEKALEANDESISLQKEADIYANLANVYFRLKNYSRASTYYAKAISYKKVFRSLKEEALFYYHYGYCKWQEGDYTSAYNYMHHAYQIYQTLGSYGQHSSTEARVVLYRYFALFERMQGKYSNAIAWYKKAYALLEQQGYDTQKVRLLVEIAECYRRLNDDGNSLLYLGLAKRMIKDYSSSQYKIGWKVLGIGPLYFFDVGQDAVVIGDSKIVSELSPLEMDILIHNMEASLYEKNADYRKALECYESIIKKTLNAKVTLLREVHTHALVQAGMCCERIGEVQTARTYYHKALEFANQHAMSPETIISILSQIAYSYSTSVVYNDQFLREIEGIIKKIEAFKANSYNMVFTKRLEEYKKRLEIQGKKLTENDIAVISEQTRDEIKQYTVRYDAIIGLLLICKAKLVQEIYAHRGVKEIESMTWYYAAIDKLSSAIEMFKNDPQYHTYIITLLINRGECRIRLHQFKEGYEDIISARFRANAIFAKDLVWLAEATLWQLSYSYKEIRALMVNPDKMIEGVLSRAYLLLPLYASKLEFIVWLYNAYTDELIARKEFKKAYFYQEQKQSVLIAHALSDIRSFHNDADVTALRNYNSTCYTIRKLEEKLSAAALQQDKNTVDSINNVLNEMYSTVQKHRIQIHSLIPYVSSPIRYHSEVPLLHLYIFNNALYAWIVTKNDVAWKLVSANIESEALAEEVLMFINSLGSKTYCVLNESFHAIYTKFHNNVLSRIGCVTSAVRVESVEKLDFLPSLKVFSDIMLSGSIRKAMNIDEAEYIIDALPGKIDITSEYCFSHRLDRSLVVKYFTNFNLAEVLLLAESAVYSGVATVVVCTQTLDPANYEALVTGNTFSLRTLGGRCIVLGNLIPDTIHQRNLLAKTYKEQESKFFELLQLGEYDNAHAALLRWLRVGLNVEQYNIFATQLLFYQGKFDEVIQHSSKSISDVRARSYSIYASILRGDFTHASTLLSDREFYGTGDYKVYSELLRALIQYEMLPDGNDVFTSENHSYALPINQLRLLYVHVALIVGEREKAYRAFAQYVPDYILSQRERVLVDCMNIFFKGNTSLPMSTITARIRSGEYTISSLDSVTKKYPDAANIVFYIYAHSKTIDTDEWQQILAQAQSRQTSWLDTQLCYLLFTELYRESSPQKAIEYITLVKDAKRDLEFNINKLCLIENYLKSYEFVKAYALCSDMKKVLPGWHKRWYTNYIYAALSVNKIREARFLMEQSRIAQWNTLLYKLFLVSAHLHTILHTRKTSPEELKSISDEIAAFTTMLPVEEYSVYYVQYGYLLEQILQFQISYFMSRGHQSNAIRYAEILTMIKGMALLGQNNKLREYTMRLIKQDFTLKDVQKLLKKDTAIVYVIKNGNDIFAWVIAKTFVQPIRIPNVYAVFREKIATYYSQVKLQETGKTAQDELEKILKPLSNEISHFKTLVCITDEHTQHIPFEILMPLQDIPIVYMPCLSTFNEYVGLVKKEVRITGNDSRIPLLKKAIEYTMGFSIAQNNNVIQLLLEKIQYNGYYKKIAISGGDVPLGDVTILLNNISELLYIWNVFMIQNEVNYWIVCNASINDINDVILMHNFFMLYQKENVVESFFRAKHNLKADRRYSNPAYWLGIRLYVRSIYSLHESVVSK